MFFLFLSHEPGILVYTGYKASDGCNGFLFWTKQLLIPINYEEGLQKEGNCVSSLSINQKMLLLRGAYYIKVRDVGINYVTKFVIFKVFKI